jgi:hypothetical protein
VRPAFPKNLVSDRDSIRAGVGPRFRRRHRARTCGNSCWSDTERRPALNNPPGTRSIAGIVGAQQYSRRLGDPTSGPVTHSRGRACELASRSLRVAPVFGLSVSAWTRQDCPPALRGLDAPGALPVLAFIGSDTDSYSRAFTVCECLGRRLSAPQL